MTGENGALLSLENIYKHFPVKASFFSREMLRVHAIDGVSSMSRRARPSDSWASRDAEDYPGARRARLVLPIPDGPVRGEGHHAS